MIHQKAALALMKSFSFDQGEAAEELDLETRLEQQNLVIQTILALMLEKGVFTEDEFRVMAKQMDELDGRRDGKLAEDMTTVACPGCNALVRKTAVECPKCGIALEPDLIHFRK
jgi:hypothetical protein